MAGEIQRSILEQWLVSLKEIPEVEVVWLEGSLLYEERCNIGSDIDVRLGIADEAYEALWLKDRTQILAGLGETLHLFGTDWERLLTKDDGIVVEVAARRSSELDRLALVEWEFVLNRLPDGQPRFTKLDPKSAAETWPDREELTQAKVWQLTEMSMTNMANCPATFFNGELQSAKFIVDESRMQLLRLLFRRTGLAFPKRYKHFSDILPPESLADLHYTYQEQSADPLDPKALAEALLRTLDMYGKHLQALSDQAGGGFEPEWYWRLLEQTRGKLQPVFG